MGRAAVVVVLVMDCGFLCRLEDLGSFYIRVAGIVCSLSVFLMDCSYDFFVWMWGFLCMVDKVFVGFWILGFGFWMRKFINE